MAIVVIGAGAIGLLIAGHLAQSGTPTTLLARPAAAAAIAEQGIRIVQAGPTRVSGPLTVCSNPIALLDHARAPELAIICVKGYDTPSLLPILADLQPQAVLTLQNGIGHEEFLAAHIDRTRVISGAITTSVEIDSPGRITVTKVGGIGLAALDPQTNIDRWVEMFSRADFDTRAFADYRALKWSKALLNMLGNATAAILDMPVDQIYANPRLVALERAISLEALRVMDRQGIRPLNLPRYPAALLALAMRYVPTPLLGPLLQRRIARGRGGKLPSLQIDLARRNQRSEGQFLYGAVASAADQIGVPAPLNHALWDLLSSIAHGRAAWDNYRQKPDQLLNTVMSSRQLDQTGSHI